MTRKATEGTPLLPFQNRLAVRSATSAPDVELLTRFIESRDEDSFTELVRRHGPVVYRLCRRLVGATAADDAFQATFLVLATRPGAARAAGSVAGWLVGVTGRVAQQARRTARRRTHHETIAATQAQTVSDDPGPSSGDQFRIVDEELTRLPDRLRGPVVTCWLEGRTQDQAAA
jgi:RNA polymerase sigma factor (sigma-70 family)